MDKLVPFQKKCAAKGRPVDIFVEEVYPGDISTSFYVKVKAAWVDKMDCSDVIDFLVDILWETTGEKIREKIFSIKVHNSKEEFHYSEPV